MKFRKLLLAGSLLAAFAAVPSQASIIDNPRFQVLGLVIVWGVDDTNPTSTVPVVADFIVGSGGSEVDLISTDVRAATITTGTLVPIDATATASAGDFQLDQGSGFVNIDPAALSAFAIDENTDVSVGGSELTTNFFVASNTAFTVGAQASLNAASNGDLGLDDIAFSMDAFADGGGLAGALGAAVGTASAVPAGSAFQLTDATLADIEGTTDVLVFDVPALTATGPGSIAEQSIRFENTYTLGGAAGYDLSQGAGTVVADIVYTIAVP